MNRFLQSLYPAAAAAGLLAIVWAGSAALRHHPLALLMTALIAGFYALGIWELQRFGRASRGLQAALDGLSTAPATPASRDVWLQALPESLREAVRQRLDGSRSLPPGPVLAPALAGLLVLLGMLGTFVGLIVTLGGTATALSASQDLSAMRNALTTPVQGLGLAFGSSVAGVAASAMLGLMTALARRERSGAAHTLERALAGPLRPFTAAERQAQVQQAQLALPQLVDQVQQLAQQLASQQAAFQQQWQAEQQRFHAEAQGAYSGLARSVDRSLRESLSESARLAGAAIQPAAEAAMNGIAREAAALHQRTADAVHTQLDALTQRFGSGVGELVERHAAALEAERSAATEQASALRQMLAEHQAQSRDGLTQTLAQSADALQALGAQTHSLLARSAAQAEQAAAAWTERFQAQSTALLQGLDQAQARHLAAQRDGDAQRLSAWRAELADQAARLQDTWIATAEQARTQQQQVADALAQTTRELISQTEAQARATIAEASALLQQAGEAPRAAAEVVGALRQQLSQSLAQDNAALAERAQLLQTLGTLLSALQQAAGEQRGAIDRLVDGAAHLLDDASQRFAAQAERSGTQLASAAQQMAGSSAGVLEQVGSQFLSQAEALSAQLAAQATQLSGDTHQLLDQAGQRFAAQAEATGQQLAAAALQLAGSAAEMGSLGEGFGAAVEQFQGANERLVHHLENLDGALARSTQRSDEQLAYYVAQARELIDLCLSSQKQAVDELRAAAQLQHG